MDKKILVTFFSHSGNTKAVAEMIQAQTDAGIFELVPKTPYPAGYHETTVIAKKEIANNVKPPLKNHIDVSGYDVIFVGTPAWWYTMAPVVKTFLSENDFENKVIVPFVTHGGGGGYKIDADMAKTAKGAMVLSSFVVYGSGTSSTVNDIANWLKSLEF